MNIIKHLKERDFIDAVTNEKLCEIAETPLILYLGFDATGESLHLGNLLGIIALKWFQRFGHTVIPLLGGATTKIGDPSGKSVERPLLEEGEIIKNKEKIRKQLEFCLGKIRILDNDDWFSRMNVIDFLRDVGKHFRLGPMLGKESVKLRIASEEGMSFTEFSYQLLQGYDFYYLHEKEGVILQIGGSDQWGNITAGIEFTRKVSGKSVYGMTWPLLTRSDGKKFGKTEEGAIWLSKDLCSPYHFYQYLYNIPDSDVTTLMRRLTFMDLEEILYYETRLKNKGCVPNEAQKRLAEEVIVFVHGKEGLQEALKVTEVISPGSKKAKLDVHTLQEVEKEMPHVTLSKEEVIGAKYIDIAVKGGLLESKSEAVRLIKNGGAYLNEMRITDPACCITEKDIIGNTYLLLGSGKKKKLLVKIL